MLPHYESLSHSVDLFRDYLINSTGEQATQRMIQQAEVIRANSGEEDATTQAQESGVRESDDNDDAGLDPTRASVGRLRASKPKRTSNADDQTSSGN